MQKQNFARTVVLQNINVTIWDIQEIDSKTGTIVIRNSNFIQFWKILTSKLAYQIPFTQNIETRVSSDHFIFWNFNDDITVIGLYNRKTKNKILFPIFGIQKIYFCQTISNKLLVGKSGCNIQIIDLKSYTTQSFSKGVPVYICNFEKCDKTLAIYNDRTGLVFGNECVDICLKEKDCMFTDWNGLGVVVHKNGKIKIFYEKSFVDVDVQIPDIHQIGNNPDTHQLFLASKGKIYIIQ